MSTDCQINVGVTLDDSPVDVAAQLALYNVGGGAVDSVNGKTGVVVLDGTEVELIDGGGVSITQAISDITTNYQPILLEGAFVDGDKTKLDGIAAGATTDQTVNGKTGASITLDGTEIDLIDGGGVSVTQAVADLEDAIPDYLTPYAITFANPFSVDVDNGTVQTITLTASTTLTAITNATAGQSGRLELTQGGVGGWVVTLPAGYTLRSGDEATISDLATGETAIVAWSTIDGATFNLWIS